MKKQAVDGVREKEFGGQYKREKINLFSSYGVCFWVGRSVGGKRLRGKKTRF